MGEKKSKYDKVLSSKDIFVIAFGAMIGWGWIVMTGEWINYGGSVGAMIAFGIGGFMVLFVGFYLCRTDIGNAEMRRGAYI